jgi:hypothetical protein
VKKLVNNGYKFIEPKKYMLGSPHYSGSRGCRARTLAGAGGLEIDFPITKNESLKLLVF